MWLDSKRYWVTPAGLRVYCDAKDGDLVVEHPGITQAFCINYYACVNELLGGVGIKLVTGTTGMKLKYKVRTTLLLPACLLAGAPWPPTASTSWSASTVRLMSRW